LSLFELELDWEKLRRRSVRRKVLYSDRTLDRTLDRTRCCFITVSDLGGHQRVRSSRRSSQGSVTGRCTGRGTPPPSSPISSDAHGARPPSSCLLDAAGGTCFPAEVEASTHMTFSAPSPPNPSPLDLRPDYPLVQVPGQSLATCRD
jgi:hypothetical protein